MKENIHLSPSTTCGIHTWKGEAPSLIKSLIVIKELISFIEEKNKDPYILRRAAKIKMAEARAWIRKYFNEASEFRGDFFLRNKVSKETMLTSKPIQAINQEEADIAKIEPMMSVVTKRIFQGRNKIKRRIIPYLGYEPKSLI